MAWTLDKERAMNAKEARIVFVDTIDAMMNEDDKVVFLEADLGGASGSTKLTKTHPERFVQCGIAEANMMGVAAGLSVTGFKPFTHTFGPFATRRVFDQVFLSGGYAFNTINIFGTDPGFTVAANGGTHTSWEDMAIMRTLPNATICDAADSVQLEWIAREFAKYEGVKYVRANRKALRNLYAEGSTFEMGKGNIIKEGTDVLVIAAGQLVSDALDAAIELEEAGISCEVVDMFCVKPLDKELVIKEAAGKKAVVTIENHSIIGGLGSACAETLMEAGVNTKFKRIGCQEKFGQVGTAAYLQKEFGLTKEDFIATIKAIVE